MERERNQALCHNSLLDKDSWTSAATVWGEILAPLPIPLGSALVMLKPKDFFLRSSELHLKLALSNENKPILFLLLAYKRFSAWEGGALIFLLLAGCMELITLKLWNFTEKVKLCTPTETLTSIAIVTEVITPKNSICDSLLLWLCLC